MDEKLDRIIQLLEAQVAATQALVQTNQALLVALAEVGGTDPEAEPVHYMDGTVREFDAAVGPGRYMDGGPVDV